MNRIPAGIIAWFKQHGRPLPWRETRDPYKIWLSEVILQQTRVQQGMAYYHRFLEKFPTVNALAKATEEEVLSTWQGLGYYSRGRNLLATARNIVENFGGKFPETCAELINLKGIGPYTASAIASFAFDENVAAVDGNVIRVVCRLFAIEDDVRLPAVQKIVHALATSLLPAGQSWDFNQSMMEFGAMVCTPSAPACSVCPVATLCESRAKSLQAKIPFKSKAAARKTRCFNYLLAEYHGYFAFRYRDKKDIWQGLFEPLLFESEKPFQQAQDFESAAPELFAGATRIRLLPLQKCILSHQEVIVSVLFLSLTEKPDLPGFRWVSEAELDILPKPVIFSKILRKAESAPLYLKF
jgi:A/G-specific adenine glycosylase